MTNTESLGLLRWVGGEAYESGLLPTDCVLTQVVSLPSDALVQDHLYTFETLPVDNSYLAPILPAVRPPVRLPDGLQPRTRFDALQKWEGRVLEVGDTTFSAVVVGIKDATEEEAEFDLEEVSPDDIDMVEPGAVFYWSIGYRTDPSGERSRCSVLVFRRLPAWSARDLELARQGAQTLRDRLGW